MCGRARCSLSRAESEAYAKRVRLGGSTKVDPTYDAIERSFNVSPGQRVPILIADADGGVTLRAAVWGLVPHFQKGLRHDHFKMFNARAEELSSKVSFNTLTSTKRCLVLTDGFYEWNSKRVCGKLEKQPWHLHFPPADGRDGKPAIMAMAGLYDVWRHPETLKELVTCTILTTASSEEIRWLHDRMPVLIDPTDDAAAARWLDVANQKTIERDMILPYESSKHSTPLKWYKVTPKMSKAAFQGEACVARLKTPVTLAKFFSPSPTSKKRMVVKEVKEEREEREEREDSDGNR